MESIFLWWIFCAIIGGAIGSTKGRTGAGVIWGGMLGPIGILVILCMGSVDNSPKCGHCGARIPVGQNTCGVCQRHIRFPERPPFVATPIESKVCPACAEEVKEAAKICRFCNHTFALPTPIPPKPSLPPLERIIKSEYFYQIAGGVHQGPVGPDEIGRLIQNKKLGPDDQIRLPQQGWHKVSDINFT